MILLCSKPTVQSFILTFLDQKDLGPNRLNFLPTRALAA